MWVTLCVFSLWKIESMEEAHFSTRVDLDFWLNIIVSRGRKSGCSSSLPMHPRQKSMLFAEAFGKAWVSVWVCSIWSLNCCAFYFSLLHYLNSSLFCYFFLGKDWCFWLVKWHRSACFQDFQGFNLVYATRNNCAIRWLFSVFKMSKYSHPISQWKSILSELPGRKPHSEQHPLAIGAVLAYQCCCHLHCYFIDRLITSAPQVPYSSHSSCLPIKWEVYLLASVCLFTEVDCATIK